ncbi:hypothetical protein L3V83_13050 [Thiotrichales bacterium 19X7-9]|nr:hypothetical protein [Thiotrichales bacterium 19X7-9]
MNNVNMNLKLRPIRFVFLVRPTDQKNILEIFKINTCLWGGMYNPIIPYFKKKPNWWERDNIHSESAREIINGYLDFFEPDYLVEAEKGLANEYKFDPNRILQLKDIFQLNEYNELKTYGVDSFHIYQYLYNKVFQFKILDKPNIIYVKPNNVKDNKVRNFIACNFGDFLSHENFNFFKTAYNDAFNPRTIALNSNELLRAYENHYISPLDIGSKTINVITYYSKEPTLYIFNLNELKDLIDYWNLRIIYRQIIAIPIQWINDLNSYCKNFLEKNYRPLPGNPNGVMIQPCLLFSRSISKEQINQCNSKLRIKGIEHISQDFYPPIWRKPPCYSIRKTRSIIEADDKQLDVNLKDDLTIKFNTLSPKFIKNKTRNCNWVNVIDLQSYNYNDLIGVLFPYNYRNPKFPIFDTVTRHPILSTSEGLITFSDTMKLPKRWQLFNGTTYISQWLKSNNFNTNISDAGKITQQIIKILGGSWNLSLLTNEDFIKLLNEISRKHLKCMNVRELKNKIKNCDNNKVWQNRVIKNFIKNKIFKLGLTIKCDKCNKSSWYDIATLDYILKCEFCHKNFDFPSIEPNHNKWSYRLTGPFALPNYAQGAYATALTIHFFDNIMGGVHSKSSWSPGQEIIINKGEKIETDFIIWHRKFNFNVINNNSFDIIFGEVKSFGRNSFKHEDVKRMKTLAKKFPGSIIVFSTMKNIEDFSSNEKKIIRSLANWGRHYIKNTRQSRAPVILLTGIELFSKDIYITWKQQSEKHKEMVKYTGIDINNPRTFADLTQQLYLNMTSYSEWLRSKKSSN